VVNTIADEIVGIRDTISKLERIYEQLLEFIVGYINYEYRDVAFAWLDNVDIEPTIVVRVKDEATKDKLLNEDEIVKKLYEHEILSDILFPE